MDVCLVVVCWLCCCVGCCLEFVFVCGLCVVCVGVVCVCWIVCVCGVILVICCVGLVWVCCMCWVSVCDVWVCVVLRYGWGRFWFCCIWRVWSVIIDGYGVFICLICCFSCGFGFFLRVRGFEKFEWWLCGVGVVGEDVIVVFFLCDFVIVVVFDGVFVFNVFGKTRFDVGGFREFVR